MSYRFLVGLIIATSASSSAHSATVLSGDAVIFAPNATNGAFLGAGIAGATGAVTIDDGSVVDLDANPSGDRPQAVIGEGGGDGDVTITGANSQLRLDGNGDGAKITLGVRFDPAVPGGVGDLEVTNGGSVELTDSALAPFGRNVVVQIGEEASGTITLDDARMSLISSGDTDLSLAEGSGGQGTISATNGSLLELQSDAGNTSLSLGNNDGLGKSATVEFDNSTLNMSVTDGDAFVRIGGQGTNANAEFTDSTVSITSGGATNGNAEVRVGTESAASAALVLDGNSSMELVGSNFARLQIGDNGATSASVTVSGSSELTVDSSGFSEIQVGAGSDLSSPANLTVSDSSTVSASDRILIGNGRSDGDLNAVVSVVGLSNLSASEVFVNGGGLLQGTGTVTGDVFVSGNGVVGPGLSPGELTIQGDLTLGAGSGLEIEFAGSSLGEFDTLNLLGDLVVDSFFNLTLSFIDGFAPIEGQQFSFLNVGGSFDDGFLGLANVNVLGLGSGFEFSFLADGSGGVSLRTDSAQVIPLPMPALLLLTGFGALLGVSRRRRAA